MGFRHTLTRFLISNLPTDTGLWRLKPFLPNVPDSANLITKRLRGHPLRLKFRPGTYMGWYLYYRGMYEEHAVSACVNLLREGMNFVDVGANYGLYTVIAAAKVGAIGRVLSLEPQPDLVQVLAENASINSLENIIVKPYALGAAPGAASLYLPSRTNDGAAVLQLCDDEESFKEPISVVVQTLPRVLEECQISTFQGMKVDVEGAELAVLQGAAPILSGKQPEFMLLECIENHLRRFNATSKELFGFLWDFGYRTACFHRGRWRTVSSYSHYMQIQGPPDVLAVHPSTASWDIAARMFSSVGLVEDR